MKCRPTREHQHKCVIFVLTFFCYAMFHANRHAFSNVKTSTQRVWSPAEHNESLPSIKPDSLWNAHDMFDDRKSGERFQGVLDTAFMLSYATGLFLNGYIGDRVDMRILLTIGTAGTSITNFIFGCVCEWTHFYNKYFYVFIWIINGLMQSTGWPVVVACMGNWFGVDSRGVLLGIWSSCASVGNIMGALMVASVLSYGYQYCFLMTSCVSMAAASMVFFGLITTPVDVGYEVPKVDESESLDDKSSSETTITEDKSLETSQTDLSDSKDDMSSSDTTITEEKESQSNGDITEKKDNFDADSDIPNDWNEIDIVDKKIDYDTQTTVPASMPFWKAILLPGVIAYSLAYAFLKLVNYSFFFWLPFYLGNALHFVEGEAAKLSTVYDVAGIVGGTLVGFISDRVGKRTVLIVPMLLLSIPSLFLYSNSPDDMVANIALMFLVGFFIAGVANLISAAVSADLGCQKQLRGDDRALATVTGVIDGTGSFGAALGQIAVPYLQTYFDWYAVFYLFMICMFMTSMCLLPLFFREMKSFRWFLRLTKWVMSGVRKLPCFSCVIKSKNYSFQSSDTASSVI